MKDAEDREGYRCELRYLRDKEGREIDFVILKNGDIQELIEVKYAEENVTRSLRYYVERLRPQKATQIVATLKNHTAAASFRSLTRYHTSVAHSSASIDEVLYRQAHITFHKDRGSVIRRRPIMQ